jgi:hypothetical protein
MRTAWCVWHGPGAFRWHFRSRDGKFRENFLRVPLARFRPPEGGEDKTRPPFVLPRSPRTIAWRPSRVALLRCRRPRGWWWRRGHWPELGKDGAQYLYARRERKLIGLDGLDEQVEECECLLVGQLEAAYR